MTPEKRAQTIEDFRQAAYDALMHLGGSACPAEILALLRKSDRAAVVRQVTPIVWEHAVKHALDEFTRGEFE